MWSGHNAENICIRRGMNYNRNGKSFCLNNKYILKKEGDAVLLNHLREEKVDPGIVEEIERFQKKYPAAEEVRDRIPHPSCLYYGREVWEQAATALLCGRNVLLAGHKASGKNIFAENLAAVFQRPLWNISFHVNMDAATLIGTDTFENGKVVFRPGPVTQCAAFGGFGILDEINMARNEAMAVLHAALDFRRVIDVPGYDRIALAEPARLIGTMNYGYAGTRELNEALVSRFVVIQMPIISGENLRKLLQSQFPRMKARYTEQFSQLFLELQKRCENSEISSRAMDLRGLLDAAALTEKGLDVYTALDMGITNKTFDPYEQTLIRDTIRSRISRTAGRTAIFEM